MSYTVCIDIGGTFTDCLVTDTDTGQTNIFKSPSTPGAFIMHHGEKIYEGAPSQVAHDSTVTQVYLVEAVEADKCE